MEENIQMGMNMLLIGMTTVFFILFFVVAGGSILIRLTNKFYPVEQAPANQIDSSGDTRKIAAIVAAVDIATAGKGKVTRIKKIN